MSYQSDYSGAQVDEAVGKALNPDATPTENSTNFVESGGVYDVLAPLRSVDATPTPSSTNLVQSGGVASAISAATFPNTTVARTKMIIISGNGGTGSFTVPRKSSGITPGFLIVGGRSNVGTIAVFYNEWGEKLTIIDTTPANWSISFTASADGTSSTATITNNGRSSAQFQVFLWDFQ